MSADDLLLRTESTKVGSRSGKGAGRAANSTPRARRRADATTVGGPVPRERPIAGPTRGGKDRFNRKPEELVPILETIQKTLGYLPEHALLDVARLTKLPPATVYGVATFYEQFRLSPGGKHTVRLCRGTACHVRGAERIQTEVQNAFAVEPGETTEDGSFTLETVACFGSCALAPVVVIDGKVRGRMTPARTCHCLNEFREEAGTSGDSG